MESFMTQFGYYVGIPFILIGLVYLSIVFLQIKKGKRTVEYSSDKMHTYLKGFLAFIPVFLGIWIFPIAMNTAEFLPLSSPEYFTLNPTVGFFILAITLFYAMTQLSIFFPHENKYYNIVPSLLVLATLPGLANSSLVVIINQFINGTVAVEYLILFFTISTYIMVLTSRLSSRAVVVAGNWMAHDLNMKIFRNLFKFSYRDYEKTASGRIYTILNDDIGTMFFFTQHLPGLYASAITILVVSIYLWTISFTGSMLLLGTALFILLFQNFFTGSIKKVWNHARNTREGFTDLITGLVNGFKELIVHQVKRKEYFSDLEEGSDKFYKTHRDAMYVDIDKTIFANLSFIVAIGTSCLVLPIVLGLEKELITTFVITMLFLWSPMGTIISAIPGMLRVQVSRQRINKLLNSMNSVSTRFEDKAEIILPEVVEKLELKNIVFSYDPENLIGPISMEAKNGEITFIIGGNGSGKTTLLKVLIGLYESQQGQILINGKAIDSLDIGEYFSIIYSDFYMFKKIYGIKPEKLNQVNEWLKMLGLEGKSKIENGAFTTINLSKGQRKRLSILRSYLEDRPINIYDECAADLDPEFKEFFYNVLLPKMKRENKVVIIISHDDGYFSSADRIYKMTMGKSELIKSSQKVPELQYAENGVKV